MCIMTIYKIKLLTLIKLLMNTRKDIQYIKKQILMCLDLFDDGFLNPYQLTKRIREILTIKNLNDMNQK